MRQNHLYSLTVCALMAAVLCILSPMVVPIGPIPVSLATFVIYAAGCILSPREAGLGVVVYLLLGAVGLPVFSGYQGGLAKLAGPTGGYLVGYVFLVLICSLAASRGNHHPLACFLGMVLGTAGLYVFGTAWFMFQTGTPLAESLGLCVLPFIPVDLGKMAVAVPLSHAVRRALEKANLLPQQREDASL